MEAVERTGAAPPEVPAAAGSGYAALLRALGPAWVLVTFLSLAVKLLRPLQAYDDGIVLTNSWLVLEGGLPYRDFYTNYPPGIFLLIAGLWKLTGVSVLASRALGLAVVVLLAVVAGRLAGRIVGRGFGWFSAGLVQGVLVDAGLQPSAWMTGLTLAFLSCELLLQARERGSWRWVAAGGVLGAVGCLRHDLLAYLCLGLTAAAALHRVRGGRLPAPRELAVLAVSALVPFLCVWGWMVREASLERVVRDQILEILRHMPSRSLPLGPLLGTWQLWAVLLAPLFGLLGVALRKGREDVLLAAVLSFAVLPYVLGRTDMSHVRATLPPATVILPTCVPLALGAWLGPGARRKGTIVLFAALALPNLGTPWVRHADDWRWTPLPHAGRVPETNLERADLRQVLRFVEDNTLPGEPIFVGIQEHTRAHCNEMLLYFLAHRPGGTRWMQFDPGLTNRDDVQAEMVEELERNGVRVVVLGECRHAPEDNASRTTPGSTRLDAYLDERFEVAATVDGYTLLERR